MLTTIWSDVVAFTSIAFAILSIALWRKISEKRGRLSALVLAVALSVVDLSGRFLFRRFAPIACIIIVTSILVGALSIWLNGPILKHFSKQDHLIFWRIVVCVSGLFLYSGLLLSPVAEGIRKVPALRSGLVCAGVLVVGGALHAAKYTWPRTYASVEILAGTSAGWVFAQTLAPEEPISTKTIVGFLGAVYILIRGLDNYRNPRREDGLGL